MKAKPTYSVEAINEIVAVDRIIAGGLGFGRRHNGEPVFVRGAVPGDRVELFALEKHKGYSRANEYRLAAKSPARRPAPCEYQTRCGGCDLMVLDNAAQRAAKHAMVLDVLQRTAKLDATERGAVPLAWRAPQEAHALGYRSRVRLHLAPNGRLGFRAEQSHEIVEVSRCLVANPGVNAVLSELSRCAQLQPRLFDAFEQVEIRALGDHPDLMWFPRQPERPHSASGRARRQPALHQHELATAQTIQQALATLRRSLANLVPQSAQWLMSARSEADSWRANAQTATLDTATSGEAARLLFAPGMFTQVNWQVNQTIVRDVLQRVGEHAFGTFLDLYCGAGNFSLPLLSHGMSGVGVESNPLSIAAAQLASDRQNLGGRFTSADVPRKLQELVQRGEAFDLVLLDPPRAGFKDAAVHLPKLARKAVFVCSCDPTTFARDLRTLLDLGFVLERLWAYDMFPQTHHVELTAWLYPREP